MTQKTERTDVESNLWRKKVDNSFFRHKGTTVPRWVAQGWDLEKYFPDRKGFLGKKDPASVAEIRFKRKIYSAHVTTSHPAKRANKVHRLWFPDEIVEEMKSIFNMSYMRDIESALRGDKSDIEKDIPFWEFVDIEFIAAKKLFKLTAHYTHEPYFPELFKHLGGSPALKTIEDLIFGKKEFRIHKQDWKSFDLLDTEIGATNVIYYLADTKNSEIYIGEAENLISRLHQHKKTNSNWELYRYEKLPNSVTKIIRVALERMTIRSYAAFLSNQGDVRTLDISRFSLANKKIDN
jgi:hypothetical protein|tara:strand:+ start:1851 stop:2729 length:879 start_codon:yes stop_codon:yes gene_type:complete